MRLWTYSARLEARYTAVLTVLAFILGLYLAGIPRADAHNVNQYPNDWNWQYTILNRVFYHSPNEPTNWPNGWTARTNDAMDRWNQVPSMNLVRSLGGPAGQNTWTCGDSFDFIAKGTIDSGAAAQTSSCSLANSTVRIKFSNDITWYKGSDTPGDQTDYQGALMHELGHAIMAWGACTDGNANDLDPCEGNHYDKVENGQICNVDAIADWTTMCWPKNTPFHQGEWWRMRSLEEHDKDLAQAMY